MQENHHGMHHLHFHRFIREAPNPKLKNGRTKRVDFDELVWSRYISEEDLLEAIPTVYGCDPRDTEKYKELEQAVDEANGKYQLQQQTLNGTLALDENQLFAGTWSS